MDYATLGEEELLRLTLGALSTGRDAEALQLVKALLARNPEHVYARYLLAAQHAQIGMFDEAEAEFRDLVADPQSLPMARFQFAQLLLTRGRPAEAAVMLQTMLGDPGALGAFARGLAELSEDRPEVCVEWLEKGLGMPQEVPALAGDMHRLRDALIADASTRRSQHAPSRVLSGYEGRI